MPYSMTGFARQQCQADWGDMSCEIRSVNHRYLEPLIRLPELLRSLEPDIREQLRKAVQRGKIEVNFQLTLTQQSQQSIKVNTRLLEHLHAAVNKVKANFASTDTTPIDPMALLQWPGVIEESAPNTDAITQSAGELLAQTIAALLEHRQREGDVLQQHIEERLDDIGNAVVTVRSAMPGILQGQRDKLRERLAEFQTELDENRIEQEMVLLANKADVAEELDRLETHLTEVRHILKQPKAIGRRLDFMMQELNREANTLSSKSLSSETTQAAVSIKVLIEQMREQIQNIE